MGATLPLLVGQGVERSGNVGRSLATLYFANTLGGATAAIATGVLLMRWLGLQGSVLVAAAVNALVAVLATLPPASGPQAQGRTGAVSRSAWAMAGAALAGFISLSHEILWYRVYAFGTGGTLPVFGILLGIYLLGMAVGALLAQRLCGDASANTRDRIARWAGLLTAAAGAVAYCHIPLATWFAEHRHVAGAMPFAGVAAGLYGAVLPLVGHVAVPPDRKAGQGVSYVYLANIVGACLGSVLTGFLFLEYLGVASAALLLLVVSTATALLLLRGVGGPVGGRHRPLRGGLDLGDGGLRPWRPAL